MSLATRITDLAVAVAQRFNSSTFLIPCSGRFYCYADLRWVTDSDDNYGPNYYQLNENCGLGVEPLIEWEHMGTYIPAGRRIRKLHFAGKSNNTQVLDLEMRVVIRKPSPITRWETGLDNDGEDVVQTLYTGNFKTAAMTGNSNDFLRRELDLGDVEVTEDSMVSIYVRPVGVLTATRYFRATWSWEVH